MMDELEIGEDVRALIVAFKAGCAAEQFGTQQESWDFAGMIVELLRFKSQDEMVCIVADLLLLYCATNRE
jgi:hypothetical protein